MGAETVFTYDKMSRPIKMSSEHDWVTLYKYDKRGLVTEEVNTVGDSVLYAYDEAGNQTAITYPDGSMVKYAYDQNNRLTTVTGSDGKAMAIQYKLQTTVTGYLNSIDRSKLYNIIGEEDDPNRAYGDSYITRRQLETLLNKKVNRNVAAEYIMNDILDALIKAGLAIREGALWNASNYNFDLYDGDPARAIEGSGIVSDPQAWNRIITSVKEAGGTVRIVDSTTMGYSPLGKGVPGEIVISKDASLSALLHEYQHFADDMAAGWPGMEGMMSNTSRWIEMEQNAYNVEIQRANQLGYKDLAKKLWENFLAEKSRILEYYLPTD